MENFKPGIIDKLFFKNATRILDLGGAIERADAAATGLRESV
jgi:hypothetical protein